MRVHSLENWGVEMGAHSFFYKGVRAERHSKNMGALNTLIVNLKDYYFEFSISDSPRPVTASAKLITSPFDHDGVDESEHEDEIPITNLTTNRSISSITVG